MEYGLLRKGPWSNDLLYLSGNKTSSSAQTFKLRAYTATSMEWV